MILVIPAIEIKDGRCVRRILGVEGYSYSDDPVAMALLWRTENAQSLHITDLDGVQAGHLVNTEVIGRMVAAVDIPFEMGGGLRSFGAVEEAFRLGAYRAVVGTPLLDLTDETRRALQTFGTSKVVLGIDAMNGIVMTRVDSMFAGKNAVDVARMARELGFRRVVYTDVGLDGSPRGVDLVTLRALGEHSGLRVTCAGGISGLEDLLRIQELEPFGVDSAVIGRALCENKFSCQGLWRRCEAGSYPFTARV
jgi:phosphoribosylformimino-5-aminoimidazole carboxamide ribotide isomerase